MFESGRKEVRIIPRMCAVILLGCAVSAACHAQTETPKAQEPAAADASKAAEAKSSQPQDKPKKDADPNAEKQKQLADDTARLLQLANELKAEMDKSTKDTLSLTVVKKAEEVEKLAHKVRDEMKKSIGN
jgi:hypothetical protein